MAKSWYLTSTTNALGLGGPSYDAAESVPGSGSITATIPNSSSDDYFFTTPVVPAGNWNADGTTHTFYFSVSTADSAISCTQADLRELASDGTFRQTGGSWSGTISCGTTGTKSQSISITWSGLGASPRLCLRLRFTSSNAHGGARSIVISTATSNSRIDTPYTATVTGSLVKVWNGSSWVEKPLKRWNGSAWVEASLKRWTGSVWELQ